MGDDRAAVIVNRVNDRAESCLFLFGHFVRRNFEFTGRVTNTNTT